MCKRREKSTIMIAWLKSQRGLANKRIVSDNCKALHCRGVAELSGCHIESKSEYPPFPLQK